MLQLALWPILAVWMGLAFVVFATIVGTIGWSTGHLLHDSWIGERGELWCPAHRRNLHVTGTPRRFQDGSPFVCLRRCEWWGKGPIRCNRPCLMRSLVGGPA